MLAVGLGTASGIAGFGLVAPVLAIINADIGPDLNLTWVALANTLTSAVGFLLVGRLSDLFGRRWFSIGAEVLIGIGAAAQLSFSTIVGELVPIKYRYFGNAYCYVYAIPSAGFSPAIAYALVKHAQHGWRWCFYILIIVNAISTLCWYFCYYPPNFQMKNRTQTKREVLKRFDYIGTFLYMAGLLLFLMGLSWGGVVHPWKYVVSAMTIGGILLIAFTLYGIYAPLEEPLMPVHLFRNTGWVACVPLLSIGASIYYAFAIIWPSMVTVLYAKDATDSIWIGLASSITGCGIVLGEIIGRVSSKAIGKVKYQIMAVFTLGAIFLACCAVSTPTSKNMTISLLFVGCTFIGWNEVINLTTATICIKSQKEISTATGIAGASRSAISTVAATIYTVVLTNRLSQTIGSEVPAALTSSGLPASSVPFFLTAISTGNATAMESIPGLTPSIQAAGLEAYKWANAHAYRAVFLTTLAISGIGMIASFWVPNMDAKLTSEVSATLHERKTEEVVGSSKV